MKAIKTRKKELIFSRLLPGFAFVFLIFVSCGENKEKQNEDEGGGDASLDYSSVKENNRTVSEFVTFVRQDDNKMGLDHQYTNEALNKLVAATRAMAQEVEYDIEADLAQVKQYADKITNDPTATTHADNIRKSADIVAGALGKMQQEKYPELENEVNELKESCGEIKPEVLTLEQKDAVKSFFTRAADVLEKMN